MRAGAVATPRARDRTPHPNLSAARSSLVKMPESMRRFALETLVLIVAAVLCAAVANSLAARERKLAWVGDYPNARVVPPVRTSSAETLPVVTTTTAEPPAATTTEAADEAAPAPAPATGDATRESAGTPSTAEPARAAPSPATPRYTLADFPPQPDKPAVEISPAQTEALWKLGATFIDARRTQVYEQGHIARARSMPVWESDIDDRVLAFYEEGHPQEAPIVIYCSGGACEDSHMLAQKLWGVGFNNILVYTDGWPDWSGRGLPTARGPAQ